MLNCTQQEVRFINANHEVIATLPASDDKVVVVLEQHDVHSTIPVMTLGGVVEIPFCEASAAVAVKGLPGDRPGLDILVTPGVAEAMRYLGIFRSGKVYTLMPLVFSALPEKRPIGAPGVLVHSDLSRVVGGESTR